MVSEVPMVVYDRGGRAGGRRTCGGRCGGPRRQQCRRYRSPTAAADDGQQARPREHPQGLPAVDKCGEVVLEPPVVLGKLERIMVIEFHDGD